MPLSDTLVSDQLSDVRRPLWFRSLITLWGIWFATALTEPAGFLACPMHSGGGHHATVGQSADAQVADAHVAEVVPDGADHSGHEMHRAAPEPQASATESGVPDQAHVCSCLGDCCSSTPARVADAIAAPALVIVSELRDACPVSDGRIAHTARDHALPFAIGPPIAPAA